MDPLNDPRFPDRPPHPDFWRLSQAVLQNDANATESESLVVAISDLVDTDSVTYMALGRAARAVDLLGIPRGSATWNVFRTAMAAQFIDGVAAGVRYQQAGGHRD